MRRNKDEGDKGLKGMSTGGRQAAENGNRRREKTQGISKHSKQTSRI